MAGLSIRQPLLLDGYCYCKCLKDGTELNEAVKASNKLFLHCLSFLKDSLQSLCLELIDLATFTLKCSLFAFIQQD